jgi:antitoxin CptB
MSAEREKRIKRLMFRSHHMGTAENDLLFGAFARMHLADLSDPDLAAYEELLAQHDSDLYKWVTGKEAPPPAFDTPLMALIKNVKIDS